MHKMIQCLIKEKAKEKAFYVSYYLMYTLYVEYVTSFTLGTLRTLLLEHCSEMYIKISAVTTEIHVTTFAYAGSFWWPMTWQKFCQVVRMYADWIAALCSAAVLLLSCQ